MTKTICDVCGKEISAIKSACRIEDYKFCISSFGRIWDICNDCRQELNEWLKRKSQENLKELKGEQE